MSPSSQPQIDPLPPSQSLHPLRGRPLPNTSHHPPPAPRRVILPYRPVCSGTFQFWKCLLDPRSPRRAAAPFPSLPESPDSCRAFYTGCLPVHPAVTSLPPEGHSHQSWTSKVIALPLSPVPGPRARDLLSRGPPARCLPLQLPLPFSLTRHAPLGAPGALSQPVLQSLSLGNCILVPKAPKFTSLARKGPLPQFRLTHENAWLKIPPRCPPDTSSLASPSETWGSLQPAAGRGCGAPGLTPDPPASLPPAAAFLGTGASLGPLEPMADAHVVGQSAGEPKPWGQEQTPAPWTQASPDPRAPSHTEPRPRL